MSHQTKRQYSIPEICKLSGKVPLSEAQCQRKLGKYQDIVRYYRCPDPNCGWHLTSSTIEKVIKEDRLSHAEQNKLSKFRIKRKL